MKKFLSVLMISVLLIGMMPAIPLLAEQPTSGTTGDCTWTLDGTVLTISGNGAMESYGGVDVAPWGTSITEVIIKNGVTSIGSQAFRYSTKLTSITIPNSVSKIENGAFENCTGLISIIIPDGVTSIGGEAFYGCTGLTSITIPDSVTSVGYDAFYNCTGLTSVYITDLAAWCSLAFPESGGKPLFYAENLYLNNELVKDLTIPDSVTSIGDYAFYGYTGLTSVTIPNSVTSIGVGAFSGCSELTSIIIPNSVTIIREWTFNNCGRLTSITIQDGATGFSSREFEETGYYHDETNWKNGILYINNCLIKAKETVSEDCTIKEETKYIANSAFSGCTELTSVAIPKSVTSIGSQAFYNCGRLTDVYYGGTKEEWKQVFIGAQNEAFLRAEIHYTEPHSHSFTTYVYNNDATTEKDGTKTATCTCGEKDTVTAPGTKLHKHTFTNYVYNNDATAEKDGTKTATCTCGAKDTVTAVGTKIKNPFTDVKAGEYYTDPVLWAVGKEITNGTSATTFSPNAQCTRGQIVTFLWRAAGSPEPQSTRNPFKDVKSDQYYYKAVLWAVEKGVTTGVSATEFAPNATCTRGQVVTFLWRAKGKPSATATTAFTDVKAGQYYTNAVAWAVKNGITTGMSATQFAPDATCTRGQIVTFLYRAYK